MNTNKEAIALELSKPIELAKTLERLFGTKDFVTLYDAYTKDLLQSKTINLGRTSNPIMKEQLHAKIASIGDFIQFVDEIANDGLMAAQQVALNAAQEIEDAKAEGESDVD